MLHTKNKNENAGLLSKKKWRGLRVKGTNKPKKHTGTQLICFDNHRDLSQLVLSKSQQGNEQEEGRLGGDEGKFEWKLSEVNNKTLSRAQNKVIEEFKMATSDVISIGVVYEVHVHYNRNLMFLQVEL